MAVIPIWPGSSSFFPGVTPFGFYDYQYQFQVDADKVAKYCAYRLGYPIENVELQSVNFYTAFEMAVTTYGNELYAFQTRDNYLSYEGAPTTVDVNNTLITPSMESIVRLSQQYGEEVEAATYKITIKRIGTSTALVSTVQEIGTTNSDTNMATAVFTIDANDTNESLRIQFTPPSTAGSTSTFRVNASFIGTQIRY